MVTTPRAAFASLLLFVAAGCKDEPPPLPTLASAATSSPRAKGGAKGPKRANAVAPPTRSGSKLAWEAPSAWKKVAYQSPFRMATYAVTAAEGDKENATLTVSQVGGGVKANIERWKGQFEMEGDADITEKKVNGLTVTIVRINGKMKGGGGPMMRQKGGADKEGWSMLSAIVHTSPRSHFFKMTGPRKTVDSAQADFDKLVASFKE